jgi:hypothetical protein
MQNMTMLATRVRELENLEGFEVEIFDSSGAVDMRQNGLTKYAFEKKAKGDMTVSEWKTKRFQKIWPVLQVRVLYGGGIEAGGNAKLTTVRASYEEDGDEISSP